MPSATGTATEEASAANLTSVLNTGIIITGGSSGLGRETALLLAAAHRPVAIWGTDLQKAQRVAQLCKAAGIEAIGLAVDVGDRAAVLNAVTVSRNAIGIIGGLVCAAARMRLGPVGVIDFAEWDLTMRTNLTGVAYTLEAVLPALREAGRGASVVLVASTEGLRGSPALAAYAASKHGVVGLMRSASLKLARSGIRVNAVCAGAMDTPMMTNAIADAGEAVKQQMIAAIPLGYIAHPREVAHVVTFLLSHQASYVTGAAIPVDGGMMT